jgi:ABC-type antimicrobial peptide transport system permease subunit
VVIVNESAAKRFWPGESALGKAFRLGTEPVTIVGIARDSKYDSLSDEGQPFVYKPFAQAATPLFEGTLFIKSSDPSAAVSLVRSLVATLDPSLAVSNLNAFEQRLGLTLLPNRAVAVTSGFLGLIALGLGTIGTYSVMAFLVLQRRREIGIRIALGAMPRGVVAMITGQGIRWTVIGLAIGVAAAIGAMQLIEGLIVGVSGSDPVPVLLVVLLLGSVGALACFLPARQAGSADPIAVLRE